MRHVRPLGELENRLAALPPETEIVAYCRGPYCVLAPQPSNSCADTDIKLDVSRTGFPNGAKRASPSKLAHHRGRNRQRAD